MELVKGQLVFSRQGRDVARLYAVLAVEGGRALVCDGKKRSLAQPKAKNLRHLAHTSTVLSAAQMQTDTDIKAALAAFCEAHGLNRQGGG